MSYNFIKLNIMAGVCLFGFTACGSTLSTSENVGAEAAVIETVTKTATGRTAQGYAKPGANIHYRYTLPSLMPVSQIHEVEIEFIAPKGRGKLSAEFTGSEGLNVTSKSSTQNIDMSEGDIPVHLLDISSANDGQYYVHGTMSVSYESGLSLARNISFPVEIGNVTAQSQKLETIGEVSQAAGQPKLIIMAAEEEIK